MFETNAYANLFDRISATRAYREEFLATVQSGEIALQDIFERGATDPFVGSLKVLPAVEAVPGCGKVQTRRAFEEVGIAEDAHVEHVSDAQVSKLPEALERHAR